MMRKLLTILTVKYLIKNYQFYFRALALQVKQLRVQMIVPSESFVSHLVIKAVSVLVRGVVMSFLKNLVQKTEGLKKQAEVVLEKVIKVPAHIKEERMEICKSCEHLSEHLHQCHLCGCFMEAKTWLPGQHCPIHKWDKHIIATDSKDE